MNRQVDFFWNASGPNPRPPIRFPLHRFVGSNLQAHHAPVGRDFQVSKRSVLSIDLQACYEDAYLPWLPLVSDGTENQDPGSARSPRTGCVSRGALRFFYADQLRKRVMIVADFPLRMSSPLPEVDCEPTDCDALALGWAFQVIDAPFTMTAPAHVEENGGELPAPAL